MFCRSSRHLAGNDAVESIVASYHQCPVFNATREAKHGGRFAWVSSTERRLEPHNGFGTLGRRRCHCKGLGRAPTTISLSARAGRGHYPVPAIAHGSTLNTCEVKGTYRQHISVVGTCGAIREPAPYVLRGQQLADDVGNSGASPFAGRSGRPPATESKLDRLFCSTLRSNRCRNYRSGGRRSMIQTRSGSGTPRACLLLLASCCISWAAPIQLHLRRARAQAKLPPR
jgi:hypothetical protein